LTNDPARIVATASSTAACMDPHSQSLGALGTERDFKPGHVLARAGSSIKSVFFVQTGLISIFIPLEDGHAVEVAMAGSGMVLGGGCVHGRHSWLNTISAQIAGVAREIPSREFAAAAATQDSVKTQVFRSEEFISAQAQQTAACNATHLVEQRLCTWLLRAQTIADVEELPFTQEFLAGMLGSQRGVVSGAAARLQKLGLLHYRRGHIVIPDRNALESKACECYRAVNQRIRLT